MWTRRDGGVLISLQQSSHFKEMQKTEMNELHRALPQCVRDSDKVYHNRQMCHNDHNYQFNQMLQAFLLKCLFPFLMYE